MLGVVPLLTPNPSLVLVCLDVNSFKDGFDEALTAIAAAVVGWVDKGGGLLKCSTIVNRRLTDTVPSILSVRH